MSDFAVISRIINDLPKAHLVCVGDVVLDYFVHGIVSRISPEAPIPILLEKQHIFSLGGVGNVVRNLSSLGASCVFIGVVGNDKDGDQVESLAKDLPGVDSFLVRSPIRPTTRKVRYVSQGGAQILRVDREHTTDILDATIQKMLQKVKETLTPQSGLILSDYGKGILSLQLLKELITYARSIGAFIAVDPKGNDYSRYTGASLLTPNLKELSEATGLPVEGDEAVIKAAMKLLQENEIENLLVTRSHEGMTLVQKNGSVAHIPTKAIEVYDVSGAGDTVVAAITAAHLTGASLEEAAHFSNIAAGVVVGKVGTATVSPQEIIDAATSSSASSSSSLSKLEPVTNWEEALAQVTLWHREGHKVGFTNGCFDLLHPGHIKILREARAACNRLIVGLNSDSSVRNLKGDSRPIQNEIARATVLNALECVDMVVLFSEETPRELIHYLKPDVLVKGADYKVEEIAGADFVLSSGGEVKLVDLLPGHSTTNTLKRV